MNQSNLIKSMLDQCRNLDLLYVEDDLTLSETTHETLNQFFNSILVCHNGQEALEAYKKSSFDIILTDIMMPKLDGKEMSKQIKEINPEQAIIVMSAHEESEHLMELIEIGIHKFVNKPATIDRLFQAIVITATNINNAKKVAQLSAQTEKNLADNEGLLRTIIDTVPVRIFWKDKDSVYLGCNKLFAQDAGYKEPSDIIGKSDFELPWTTEAQGYVDDDRNVLSTGKDKLSYEEQQTHADGSKVWVNTSKTLLKSEDDSTIGVLGTYVDITDQKRAIIEIQKAKDALGYQAEHDILTGLPNRILFLDRLNQAIKKSYRDDSKTGVIFLDLDRFKEINDSFGHEMGDKVVKASAKRLQEELRETDTIARFGGDEFMILVEAFHNIKDITELLEKILKSMEEPFIINDHALHLTFSAGASIFPDDGNSAEVLIRNADTAMYRAKDEGRNTYHFYTKEMTEKSFHHMIMSKNIRNALENKEFVVYYQPQIDGRTNKFLGMEALVRWNSPNDGFISPAEFIPIAEESGLIHKIGQYVFAEATSQIAKWYADGHNPGHIAINLSTIELQQEDFVSSIQESLLSSGCNPEWVELEITEGYTMRHPAQAIEMMQSLKELGIRLSIDDFGTGYSSLSYLKKLPVHKLKIDQSFVSGLPENQDDKAIIKTIISLAKTMSFDLIAEGVETVEQQSFLIQEGCDNIQGYLHARPMPAHEMEAFLVAFNR